MPKLSTYELTLDERHKDGILDVVPIQKIGYWSYEVPKVGMYAAGILISVEFGLPKNSFNSVGSIKGYAPRRLPHGSENGSLIAFESAMYRFIDQVTLLIQCDGSGNVTASCLEPSHGTALRHGYITSKISGLLREIHDGMSTVSRIKLCKFHVLKILEEKVDWSQETKERVFWFAKKHWPELEWLFRKHQEEKHTALIELQKLR